MGLGFIGGRYFKEIYSFDYSWNYEIDLLFL